ncbi:MAG: AAA family ATPase, partial [Chloroflexi bacterium]|nr:AAA family ATPase [Chloroflexota bacterium]
MAFVGRDLELARLSAALQRAADGSASRVVLRGPTGIGISALLDELEHRLGDVPGVVVARGGAFEPTSGAPFFALAGALSRAFTACADQDLARVVGGAGHDLALLLPELEPRLASLAVAMDEPRLVAPEQRGARVIEAIIGALDRLGSRGVVLLVLEDLHWADPATRAFIETLLRITRRLALCLVATYDPEEFHRRHPGRELVQALESSAQVDLLTLGPLDRDELASFAEGVLGDRPPGSLLAALLEGSRGNPLLATQLLAAHADVEGLRLSDSFEAVLQARLAALRRPAMRAVQVLAAARRPVPRQPLLRLALPEGYLAAAGLTEAIESGLAVGSGDHAGTDRVGVPHPLAAEAIERLMSPAERQAVHGVLAASLAGTPSERAWHREAAMDFAAAREAHVAAGRAAEALDPGATALLHYERALELSGDPSVDGRDPVEAAELLERAAAAASSAGAFRRAASLVQQAITVRSGPTRAATGARRDQGGSADLERTLGELHERLGRYRWAAGDQTPALEAFEKALELIPGEPSKVRARALASQAQHLMIAGRFDDSARVAEEAREVAGTVGGEALAELGHATCTLGVDLGYDGQLGRGLHLLEEATALAREAGRLDDLMRAFANRTTLLDLDSRRNDALEVVKEGLAEARRAGQEGVYGAFLRGNAADILFMLGRWSESEAECRAALEWTPAGVAWFTPTLYLSLLLTESRADDEASRMVGQTLLQLETVPAGQWTALVQRSAVSLALWRGDLADAQQVAGREW